MSWCKPKVIAARTDRAIKDMQVAGYALLSPFMLDLHHACSNSPKAESPCKVPYSKALCLDASR